MTIKYTRETSQEAARAGKAYRSLHRGRENRPGISPKRGRSIIIYATTLLILAGFLHSSVMQRMEQKKDLTEAPGIVTEKRREQADGDLPRLLMEIEVQTPEGPRRGTVETPQDIWDRYTIGQPVWVDQEPADGEGKVAIHRIAPRDQAEAAVNTGPG
jgi:hypothetical protein